MGFFRLSALHRKGDQRAVADADSPTASGGESQQAALPETKEKSSRKKDKKSDLLEGTALAATSSATAPSEGRASSFVAVGRIQPGLSVNDFISKTKNQHRLGLKPSGPELIAYARYLGIDPVENNDLLWIAEEALEAPLPSDWTEHFDSNDRVFYYNAGQRVSSWTHPLEHVYRETYKTIVNFRSANMAPQERADQLHHLQDDVQQMEKDVHDEIAQWSEHADDQGNRFYFNGKDRQSTWSDPRPAKCQVLYLRMKMLRLLQSSASGAFTPAFDWAADSDLKRTKLGSTMVGRQEDPNRDEVKSLSPRVGSPVRDSDSDSADEGKGKRKKKKKKKKRREGEMHSSQSAPSVGLKEGGSIEARGGMGGSSLMGLGSYESTEALSSAGRAKVKSGIRLEPLAPIASLSAAPHYGDSQEPSALPRGVRGSASMPSLPPHNS